MSRVAPRIDAGLGPKSGKRTAKQEKSVAEWRDEFVRSIGRCEWCQKWCGKLDAHEISQGTSRQASLTERSCVLCLGRPCHDMLHRMPEKRQVGLALLYLNRQADYSLSRFHEVTDREFPDQYEVDLWIDRICQVKQIRGA